MLAVSTQDDGFITDEEYHGEIVALVLTDIVALRLDASTEIAPQPLVGAVIRLRIHEQGTITPTFARDTWD